MKVFQRPFSCANAKAVVKKPLSWTAAAILATALALAGLVSLVQARDRDDPTPANAASAPDGNDLPVKWLPDLKVLEGAPATTLDLSDAIRLMCDEGRFGAPGEVAPEDVEISVVDGQNDFADLVVDGEKLTVAWKPGAVGKATILVKATPKDDDSERAYISFRAESWRPDYLTILMIVLGGGGLFLLGMKRMSEGLQALAGRRLRKLISVFTNNRFLALGVGFVVTTLVQSSTATSVMALGFVNGGLMTLSQAIGVLMGANIGTTTTGWLFTLNLGQYGLPLLGVSALFYLFCKNNRVHNVSIFLLGLGMIFFGLDMLKTGLEPLSDAPQFSALINAFRATSMVGAIMCVLIGCVTTVVAHSSAATLAITMTLASLGALDLNSSAAIVLGSNIGTSLTPLLVAIGAPCTTRRAAYFHVLFNTLGVVWVMPIFFLILIPTVQASGALFHLDVPGQIASTHTLFNVANTIVFLPLVGPISRFLEKHVADKPASAKKEKKDAFVTTRLSADLLQVVPSAITQANRVVLGAFDDCLTLSHSLKLLFDENFQNEERVEEAFELERRLDAIQDETILFLSQLYSMRLSEDDVDQALRQTRVVQELEKVSDYLVAILKSFLKLKESELQSPDILNEIFNVNSENVVDALQWLQELFREDSKIVVKDMYKRRNLYVSAAKAERDRYVKMMYSERFDPNVIVAIDAQLTFWRRIYEHLVNIGEAEASNARRPATNADATRRRVPQA